MTGDQQFMYGLLILGVYIFQLVILYELIKMAIKGALRELKAEDKEKAEKEALEVTTSKIQD